MNSCSRQRRQVREKQGRPQAEVTRVVPQPGFPGERSPGKPNANVLTDEANAVAVPPFGRYPDIPWGNASLKIRVHSFSSRFSVPQWRTEANEAVTKNDCGC